jgi:uncharacterized protein (TIGR00369 family)
VTQEFTPGERYEEALARRHEEYSGIWSHLGWRLADLAPGRAILEWEPDTDHSFPAGDGWIVHGGMVTALLDTAMGQSTWTLLNKEEVFLTADLRTEFYRPTNPGLVRAKGWVVHKTRRVSFASAELFDADDKLLASGRATNLIMKLPDQ